jgi:endo-1,4-beta-mannosidase
VRNRIWKLDGASCYGTSNPGGPGTINDVVGMMLDGGLNTIRIVNFFDQGSPSSPTDPSAAPYRESDWQRVDLILDVLRRSRLKAILDLSVYRNCLQNWLMMNGSGTTPYSADWSQFISFAANRVNSVNGLPYKVDPTIAFISFAGEPNPPNSGEPLKPTTQELTDFYRTVFAQWRAVDREHMLSSGGLLHLDWEEKYGNPAGSGIDWQAIFALSNNDVPAFHNYTGDVYSKDQDFTSPKVSAYCASIGKPWLTEEFGIPQLYADSDRAAWYQAVYELQREYGSSGAAFWNLGRELTSVGQLPTTFDTSPDTPLTWAAVQGSLEGPPSAVAGPRSSPQTRSVQRGRNRRPRRNPRPRPSHVREETWRASQEVQWPRSRNRKAFRNPRQ